MVPLADLWDHLLTLTADDDSAGRHLDAHADARAKERHHTYMYAEFLDRSGESTVPKKTNCRKIFCIHC